MKILNAAPAVTGHDDERVVGMRGHSEDSVGGIAVLQCDLHLPGLEACFYGSQVGAAFRDQLLAMSLHGLQRAIVGQRIAGMLPRGDSRSVDPTTTAPAPRRGRRPRPAAWPGIVRPVTQLRSRGLDRELGRSAGQ